MPEVFGEAVLALRTDDSQLRSGIAEAKVKSEQLGTTFDQTAGRSTRLGQAMAATGGSSARLAQSLNAATVSVGAHRAGMQQLSMQLGDAATMFALGARPAQIFASQIGQVVGAVQLMTGGTSKLAAFLGGPWGMALTTATVVLTPLISGLFDAEKGMKSVELASDAMGDAQSILGRVMDLTTGKINTQNKALLALARAQLAVAQVESQRRAAQARRDVQAIQDRELQFGGGLGGGFSVSRRPTDARDAVSRDFLSGKIDAETASTRFDNLRSAGVLNEDQWLSARAAVANLGVETQNQQVYEQALGALDGKGLGNLARPGPAKKKGGSSGPSAAEIEAQHAADLAKLNQEELRARLELATDAGERLAIQQEMLAGDRAARIAEVEANKAFSAAQKAAQIEVINRIYGKAGTLGADGIVVDGRPGLLGAKATRDFDREAASLQNDLLGRQEETLRAWARIAPDTESRAALERRALDLHQQIERNLLEQEIATGRVADAEMARAQLASQQQAARTGAELASAGPLESYARSLRLSRGARGELVESLIVDELEYVHQSINNAIMGRLGIKDPLLAGLIELFIQDVLIRPMAEALSKARGSGGGGGLFGTLFGGLLGAFGGGTSAGEAARLAPDVAATLSDPSFAGLFADGGLIPSGGWGIVGEAGPEPVFATAGGVGVLPNSALRQMGGNQGAGALEVRVSPSRYFEVEVTRIADGRVASGIGAYDQNVGSRVRDNLARRG